MSRGVRLSMMMHSVCASGCCDKLLLWLLWLWVSVWGREDRAPVCA